MADFLFSWGRRRQTIGRNMNSPPFLVMVSNMAKFFLNCSGFFLHSWVLVPPMWGVRGERARPFSGPSAHPIGRKWEKWSPNTHSLGCLCSLLGSGREPGLGQNNMMHVSCYLGVSCYSGGGGGGIATNKLSPLLGSFCRIHSRRRKWMKTQHPSSIIPSCGGSHSSPLCVAHNSTQQHRGRLLP